MTERYFAAKEENINEMIAFMEEELEKAGCPMKTQTAICVSMEELFVNIARYAYPDGRGSARIIVDIDRKTRIVTLVISDTGVAFNPLEKSDPDITKSAEEREVGGLGIFIVKKTMDTISYARKNNKNVLTMTKKL